VLDLPVSTLIKANASSTNGSITKVEFYEGNTKLGEDLSAPYEILWNTNNKGSYKISVVAYDSQGNSSSAEINLSADFNCNVLTGTAFGTSPAYVNGSSTYDKVFDGNINTFFDYAQVNGGYAGLDLGSAKVIRGIRFYPRSGWSARMTGGKFQASNSADFSTGVVTLYTITSQPSGSWHEVVVNNSNAYRYVRYLSPDGGYCNVAEVQFCGTTSTNQIPSVSITQPVNGASYTAPASITIQANASDADGTISKVEFYNGNTLLGSDNTSPYSYTWTGVANGNYTITAKAYDNSGAVATSAAINVSVTTPNSCNLLSGTTFGTSPAYNNGTSTYDKVFDGNINTFFDYAVAANGYAGLDFGAGKGAIINTIRFYPRATWPGRMVGGKFQGSNVADFSSGVVDLYTINTTPSVAWTEVTINSNQAFRYVRYLSPANGYCNIAEAQFCGTITSQNALPTVAITSPVNNAAFTAPASITINATASDADGTISKVEFYNGNTLLTTDYTSPYSYTWSSVAPGNYTLTAKAYDNSGAVNTSSAVTITVNSSNTGTEACSNIPEWNSSSIYVANDQVVYSGFKYKANWWTKGNNPATNSGPYQVWTKIGECASGGAFRLFIASINETIQVIPNPNNARFHIAAPTGVSLIGANVELLTMAGHKVYESTILSENEEIIPEELNIGMYLLKLTIGEKAYFTRVEIVK
ncbi:MAG TPA: Ig-like domain-containing protein, partial [Cytophagaceae bacterium]